MRAARGPVSIAARDLRKQFGERLALDGLSFGTHGGVVALLGPNGAGKTTLLRCLATVVSPDRGSLHIDGLDPSDHRQRVEIRRRLGYLPQEFGFADNATVFDVVDYVGIVREQKPAAARHAEVVRVLHAMGLADRARSRTRELSGGMKQRLGIAQALLGSPGLVLLDEPANGLDPEQRLLLREQLSRMGEHSTVIVSTHLTEEAAAFSQVLHVLDRGRVVYSGTPAGLTATASGRVWLSDAPPVPGPGHRATWRVPDGRYRSIGDAPPAGASLDEPTLEDGYLLLVGTPRPPRAA